jgi:hypothetical protein
LPKLKSVGATAIAPQLEGRTVDIAAKRAGFKSTTQYRKAATVVEMGAPETVAAMDALLRVS